MKPCAVMWKLLTGFLLAAAGLAPAAAPAASVPAAWDGVWTWTFTMPDGATVKPRLALQVTNQNLTGLISFRPGSETSITEGRVDGDRVTFKVVRERNGRRIETTYRGTLHGAKIIGEMESNWSGGRQVYPWEAVNQATSIEGRWGWGARSVELRLEQNGVLSGTLFLEEGSFPLRHGRYQAGEFTFEAERQKEGRPYTNIFQGRLEEKMLKGAIHRLFDGQTNVNGWEARRVEK